MSQPWAELFAAVLNAHTGKVVKWSLRKYYESPTKLTDSQIASHWISNSDKPLNQWLRNRVIEIRRFAISEQWKYVWSKDMTADLGTRKGIETEQVDQDPFGKTVLNGWNLNLSSFQQKQSKRFS